MTRRGRKREAGVIVLLALLALAVLGVLVQALSRIPPPLMALAVVAGLGFFLHHALRRAPQAPPAPREAAPPPPAPSPLPFERTVPTMRGERVASIAERRIADFLHREGYDYEYEARILGFRPDFHLPDHNLLIEYWGLETEEYLLRRERKTRAYLAAGYHLIDLEPEDWERLESRLRRKLKRFHRWEDAQAARA